MPNFAIENRIPQNKEIVRTWLFELAIPELTRIVPIVTPETFTTRVKSANMPGSTIEPITSDFFGEQQFFAGKRIPTTDLTVSMEETEDMPVHNIFTIWMESIQTMDWGSSSAGVAQFSGKRGGYATNMILTVYSSDGNNVLRQIEYLNAFPTSVGDVSLSYESADKVMYDTSFKFDRWRVIQ